MSKINILIPSKERGDSIKTPFLFKNNPNFSITVFLEPQEVEYYRKKLEGFNNLEIVNIKAQNKGIAFVRQKILDYVKEKGLDFFIMADDDIRRFRKIVNKKTLDMGTDEIIKVINKFKESVFSAGTLSYVQFGWSMTKPFSVNSFPLECFVMFKTKNLPDYDVSMKFKQDRDFTIKMLLDGLSIIRFNKYCFDSGVCGGNKGGLYNQYINGESSIYAYKLRDKYPDFVQIKKDKKFGVDVKVDYRKVAELSNLKTL